MPDPKIELMIIGAFKAGTTSLKNYLAQHQDLITHHNIEYTYFNDDLKYKKGYKSTLKNEFPYKKEMSKKIFAKYIGIYTSEKALIRLKKHNPMCKLVWIVRDPVKRAISSIKMEISRGSKLSEIDTFINSLKANETDHPFYHLLVGQGLYHQHLNIIRKHFREDQLLIFSFEEFKSNPIAICRKIFKWVGVEDFQVATGTIHNSSNKPKSLLLNGILKKLRSERNPLKKAVKFILPYHYFTKLAYKIVSLNTSNEKVEFNNLELEAVLNRYFASKNEEFRQQISIDISNWS